MGCAHHSDPRIGGHSPPYDPGTLDSTSRLAAFHANEDGKITLISTVTMLFFLILLCYVGNAGVAVKEKMELQDAADAAAYSTGLTLARGMNAVTVANHMLGEATGMVVILDGFGGKILEETMGTGQPYKSNESRLLSTFLKSPSPLRIYSAIPAPGLQTIDEKLIEYACKALVPESPFAKPNEKEGDHWAGAALYDGIMSLKYTLVVSLTVKSLTRLIMDITQFIPIIGPVVKVIGIGIHTFISATVIRGVVLEAVQLRALEIAITAMQPAKRLMRAALIPGLSVYADTVVSGLGPDLGGIGGARNSAVSRAAVQMVQNLNQQYSGKGISFQVHPAPDTLTLPVIKEEAPKGTGTRSQPESEWKGPFETSLFQDIMDTYNSINSTVEDIKDTLETIVDITSLFGGGGIFKAALDKLNSALMPELPGQQYAPDLQRGYYEENPCHAQKSKYKLAEFDWRSERNDQWTRGTFPYVHSIRGPIYNWMVEDLPYSNAGTFYVHWTNRYLLATSHELRTKSVAGLTQPHMYLMTGSAPDKQGYESWTTNEDEAARLFSVFAVATRRQRSPIFGPGVYSKPTRRPPLALSGAMFYNANGRHVPANRQGPGAIQPDTGWNTLNWMPPVKAPEWGGTQPLKRGEDAWDVLGGDLTASADARVQLNWQAKLVPILADGVASSRLKEAAGNGSKLSADAKQQLQEMLKHQTLVHP